MAEKVYFDVRGSSKTFDDDFYLHVFLVVCKMMEDNQKKKMKKYKYISRVNWFSISIVDKLPENDDCIIFYTNAQIVQLMEKILKTLMYKTPLFGGEYSCNSEDDFIKDVQKLYKDSIDTCKCKISFNNCNCDRYISLEKLEKMLISENKINNKLIAEKIKAVYYYYYKIEKEIHNNSNLYLKPNITYEEIIEYFLE